jgi:glutamine amidotransferase
MAGLDAVGGAKVVAEFLAADRPLLGICVGMQVLFDAGVEHGIESAGLGVLPGRVEQLRAPVLPHMGWNTVAVAPGSALFAGIPDGTRFYFVHSYAAHSAEGLVTTAEHGETFVAAVERGRVSATQFHPEKSGDAGAAVLTNWLSTL